MRNKSPAGLKIIGLLKLFTALLLIVVGVSAFHLMDRDLSEMAKRLLLLFDLDPKNGFLNKLLLQASIVKPSDLKTIGYGTFIYAALYVVEGVGLLRMRRWAEYLTIIITASLLPLEGYEIIQHVGPLKISALIINLVIVIYLIWQLKHGNRGPI